MSADNPITTTALLKDTDAILTKAKNDAYHRLAGRDLVPYTDTNRIMIAGDMIDRFELDCVPFEDMSVALFNRLYGHACLRRVIGQNI